MGAFVADTGLRMADTGLRMADIAGFFSGLWLILCSEVPCGASCQPKGCGVARSLRIAVFCVVNRLLGRKLAVELG